MDMVIWNLKMVLCKFPTCFGLYLNFIKYYHLHIQITSRCAMSGASFEGPLSSLTLFLWVKLWFFWVMLTAAKMQLWGNNTKWPHSHRRWVNPDHVDCQCCPPLWQDIFLLPGVHRPLLFRGRKLSLPFQLLLHPWKARETKGPQVGLSGPLYLLSLSHAALPNTGSRRAKWRNHSPQTFPVGSLTLISTFFPNLEFHLSGLWEPKAYTHWCPFARSL